MMTSEEKAECRCNRPARLSPEALPGQPVPPVGVTAVAGAPPRPAQRRRRTMTEQYAGLDVGVAETAISA